MKLFSSTAFKETLLQKTVCTYVCLQRDPTQTRKKIIIHCSLKKKQFLSRVLRIRGMSFKIDTLGKIDFLFETHVGYKLEDQVGSSNENKKTGKISCKCTVPFKIMHHN
jgi:hypothetical protein